MRRLKLKRQLRRGTKRHRAVWKKAVRKRMIRKWAKWRNRRRKPFNRGYDLGYNKGYDMGYEKGRMDVNWRDEVEKIINSFIPGYVILPDISTEQILAAGVEHLRPHFHYLMTAAELGDKILHALDTRSPFSLVRLGDGELLALAHGIVRSVEEVKKEGHFLGYAGINIPDFAARDRLIDSVRRATVVGIPKSRVRNFMPLAISVFHAFGIDYRSLQLTDAAVNYLLYYAGYIPRIVEGRRVLIVGNVAGSLAALMRNHGVHVIGDIAPVNGINDVPRVMNEVRKYDFDIALVAAGIPAVLISEEIASGLGKVAVDFGHLANKLVKGEFAYP